MIKTINFLYKIVFLYIFSSKLEDPNDLRTSTDIVSLS